MPASLPRRARRRPWERLGSDGREQRRRGQPPGGRASATCVAVDDVVAARRLRRGRRAARARTARARPPWSRRCSAFARRPSGTVRLHGLDPLRDHHEVVVRTGALLQRGGVWFPMTPRQVLELTATYYDAPRESRASCCALLDLERCATNAVATPERRRAAAHPARPRPARSPARPGARRADDRGRPRGAPGHPRHHPRRARARLRAADHHPRARRGRATGRPPGHHEPRTRRRRRAPSTNSPGRPR